MEQERVADTRARRRSVVVWDGRQIGGLVAQDDDCNQQKNDETHGYTSVGDGPTYHVGEPGSRIFPKHADLKLVSRLEFGSGAVAMRYEPRR
jgi:hypothetical protein